LRVGVGCWQLAVGFWLLAFGFWLLVERFSSNIIMQDLYHLNMALTKVLIAKGKKPKTTN